MQRTRKHNNYCLECGLSPISPSETKCRKCRDEKTITCMKCGAKVSPDEIKAEWIYKCAGETIKDQLCPRCGKILKDCREPIKTVGSLGDSAKRY